MARLRIIVEESAHQSDYYTAWFAGLPQIGYGGSDLDMAVRKLLWSEYGPSGVLSVYRVVKTEDGRSDVFVSLPVS